ncbi:hypothetical protein AVEN_99593-1 [Araneus ventricosus]|uniref:Uncharacterized protein n=1 Tax=Araneus ventricosus TaxID=182803 RepID=A0A4Y2ER95_ARAVE|nr:hypothetical protein AVEN_99593-1 [Araneus ventricosus]
MIEDKVEQTYRKIYRLKEIEAKAFVADGRSFSLLRSPAGFVQKTVSVEDLHMMYLPNFTLLSTTFMEKRSSCSLFTCHKLISTDLFVPGLTNLPYNSAIR